MPTNNRTTQDTTARSNTQTDLTPKEVARYPFPGMSVPGNFAFSHDDTQIAFRYSPEGTLHQQLHIFEVETGEKRLLKVPADSEAVEGNLSLEEKLRRERQRQMATGVTSYSWAKGTDGIMLPTPAGIYFYENPDSKPRMVVDGSLGPLLDPQLSPNGKWIAYVFDAELTVTHIDNGETRQLTHGARGTGTTNGLAEFIAQEEMDRSRGFWWSPDSHWLAFTHVDDTHIPIYRIVHQGQDAVGPTAQEDHRYPFAGQSNAQVKLGIVPVIGGDPVWMDLDGDDEKYLARVNWLPDGTLSAQLENREQSRLELVRFDPATGNRKLILTETSDIWINLHHCFRPLKKEREDGAAFLWASEGGGFRHLYLVDREGQIIRQLTKGNWQVDGVAGLDENRGLVYFTGTLDGPTESHFYKVSLDGGDPMRLTTERGVHKVVLNHKRSIFVDQHNALNHPTVVTLRDLEDGRLLKTIYNQVDPRIEELRLKPPEIVTLHTRGAHELYGAIYYPPASSGSGPYPLVVSVYGGPHAQRVTNSWDITANMRDQYLARLGFLVFRLDNRGSGRRGLQFEGAVKHRLGHIEVQDQADGVRWLVQQGLADPRRVGIYGWSYGGYMALMCLAQAPEIFKVAVAGAPVTSWDGYDTHYTERYMGTPESNPDGYRESSAMHYAENLTGNILLIHGLLDENVHFRHTARLINALVAAGKDYDLLLFPDGRHSTRKESDRIYLEERIGRYFLKHLNDSLDGKLSDT